MTESNAGETERARVPRLKDAMRQARIEMAERSGVVVDLRDAAVTPRCALIGRFGDADARAMNPGDARRFTRGRKTRQLQNSS